MKFFNTAIITNLLLCSCLNKTPVNKACTEEARAGLVISVVNSKTKLFLDDSLNITATDGNYTETLEKTNVHPASFSGAWEREGNYTIVVTRTGYKTTSTSPILVSKDDCHVIPVKYTVDLLPN